jgi:diaminohydroxyphosphoribosylaminopyrimidine deaminase / 5-amino-6-(5-phosphoribosylamino)uracil reductase
LRADDNRWMASALALSQRSVGITGTNPGVGCVIVADGKVIGRGWTQSGGRPHAEAMALDMKMAPLSDATVYVTLEPCAHQSERGPSCADLLVAAAPRRVVVACLDPDPRTAGQGIARLRAAGIAVDVGILEVEAKAQMQGFISRIEKGRPFVTLKLATSLDGCIAMADGTSRWITSAAARANSHLVRARSDAILVGGGTYRADAPMLDVRLPGLTDRHPRRILLTRSAAPDGWEAIPEPEAITELNCNHLLVEGGAQTAAAFLRAGLVDQLLLYRAPIMIGGGLPCLADIGLTSLDAAHGYWRLADARAFGQDRMEIYGRIG